MRRDMHLMGFDTETTGTDVETCRIVTACIGAVTPQGWEAETWLIQQDEPIPTEATAVHGITTEQAATGVRPHAALSSMSELLRSAWEAGSAVVAYNASFDFTILDRELIRHRLPTLDVHAELIIDPLVIDKAVDPYRKGSRKLIDTCAHYGITLTEDEAHSAEGDALAATRLAWKLLPELPEDPAEAMAWQADQYRRQRLSFASYLRRQGEHDQAAQVEASTSWPVATTPTTQEDAA